MGGSDSSKNLFCWKFEAGVSFLLVGLHINLFWFTGCIGYMDVYIYMDKDTGQSKHVKCVTPFQCSPFTPAMNTWLAIVMVTSRVFREEAMILVASKDPRSVMVTGNLYQFSPKLGGNRPPGDNPLLFLISGMGSFICPVAQARLDIPRPLITQ